MTKVPIYYRYSYILTSYDKKVTLYLDEYVGIKQTPCGWWIKEKGWEDWEFGEKRWVSDTSMKKFAYRTKEEALINFKFRKRKYLEILERRVRDTKLVLSHIGENYNDDGEELCTETKMLELNSKTKLNQKLIL